MTLELNDLGEAVKFSEEIPKMKSYEIDAFRLARHLKTLYEGGLDSLKNALAEEENGDARKSLAFKNSFFNFHFDRITENYRRILNEMRAEEDNLPDDFNDYMTRLLEMVDGNAKHVEGITTPTSTYFIGREALRK